FLGVALRMLARVAREHYERRIGGDDIEKAVGREIDHAVHTQRRNPADRTRYDERSEGVVRQAVIVLARIVVHLTPRRRAAAPRWRPRRSRDHRATLRYALREAADAGRARSSIPKSAWDWRPDARCRKADARYQRECRGALPAGPRTSPAPC